MVAMSIIREVVMLPFTTLAAQTPNATPAVKTGRLGGWSEVYDLILHEYGVGLRELDEEWTPGKTMLMLRRISARYERQNKRTKKSGVIELSETRSPGATGRKDKRWHLKLAISSLN